MFCVGVCTIMIGWEKNVENDDEGGYDAGERTITMGNRFRRPMILWKHVRSVKRDHQMA